MAKQSHKKPVTFETPAELNSSSVARLDKQHFDDVVYSKGYDSYIEKAMRCPCSLKVNGDALPNCRNCGGTKFVFINKKLTKVVSQGMNRQTKFLNWSEADRGNISVTVRDDDKLAFMDRITNLNLVSTYAETVRIKKISGKLIAYTIYPIIVPTEVFLFDTSDKPLKQWNLLEDFTLEDNKIIPNFSKYKNLNLDEVSISVRYTHHPQYHVIDITRDAVSQMGALKECGNTTLNTEYAALPISAVARKAHYVFDQPGDNGESLFDNTYIPNNTLQILSESLPFSLDYWLSRVSVDELIRALFRLGDEGKLDGVQYTQILLGIQDTIDDNSVIILEDSLEDE